MPYVSSVYTDLSQRLRANGNMLVTTLQTLSTDGKLCGLHPSSVPLVLALYEVRIALLHEEALVRGDELAALERQLPALRAQAGAAEGPAPARPPKRRREPAGATPQSPPAARPRGASRESGARRG